MGRGRYTFNTSITAAARQPHEDVIISSMLFKYIQTELAGTDGLLGSKVKKKKKHAWKTVVKQKVSVL